MKIANYREYLHIFAQAVMAIDEEARNCVIDEEEAQIQYDKVLDITEKHIRESKLYKEE